MKLHGGSTTLSSERIGCLNESQNQTEINITPNLSVESFQKQAVAFKFYSPGNGKALSLFEQGGKMQFKGEIPLR